MKQGWVYVLTNQGMPDLVKVGFTKNPPESRARELYDTGVAYPFEVAYQVRCYHYQAVEQAVHDYLDDKRVNDKREFFACSVQDAIDAIAACVGDDFISETDFRPASEREVKQTVHHIKHTEKTVQGGAVKAKHLLLGSVIFMALIGAGWTWLKHRGEPKLTEAQKVIGYSNTHIGKTDINLRTCSSTDCEIIAVLPKNQVLLVKQETRTDKNWIYAEFRGDVCYPQHYVRGKGCKQWAENNIIEGWVYVPNLTLDGTAKSSDSVLDTLF